MKLHKLMILTVLIFALLLGGCSSSTPPVDSDLLPIDDAQPLISATGVVVPTLWANLSLPNAGLIQEILVGEGETVTAGQTLVRLQGRETAEAAVTAAQLELVSAQQQFDHLYRDLDLVRAEAQRGLAEAQRAVDKAEKRLQSKEYQRGSQDNVDIARANYIIAEDAVTDATELFDRLDDRPEDDPDRAAALSQLAATRQKRDQALANLNYLLGRPNDLDVAEIDSNVALARAQYSEAQRRHNQLQNGPDPDQLRVAEARLANARSQLTAAQQALSNLELKAPFTGTVSRLIVRSNEWISPGQPVMMLANLSDLQVETTDLNEIDVAQLKTGDRANITFDALPAQTLHGTITRIGSKASEGSGVNYTVVLKLDEIPAQLRWGMTAFVDISVEK